MFLSFKKDLYLKEIEELCDQFSLDMNVLITLDKKTIPGNGDSKFDFDPKRMKVKIGIKSFGKNGNACSDFVMTLVTLHHELHHIEQNRDIFSNNMDGYFLFDAIAGFENREYYKKNYKNSIRELDADNNGIHQAYAYLQNFHPEINAIQHIKSYMKTRPFYEDYHDQIDQVKTIDDIDLILDQIFENLPNQRKSLDTTDDFVVLMNKYWTNTGINIMALLVQTENAIQELKEDDPERWQDLSINFLCDKTVTAFTLMKVPEYQILFDNIKERIPTPDMIVQEFQDIIREKEEIKGLP